MGDAVVENANAPVKPTSQVENEDYASQENAEIAAQVVDSKPTPENSEYDSAGSYSDLEPGEIRSRGTDHESQGSESGSEGSLILEREEGDGQESAPSRKIDDDEDKKNPQYIPKRGTFYEHDDRTADDDEKVEAAEAEKADKDGKKKVWQDKKEKWSHDKFNDNDQAPKSRSELIAIYGYDIRNEDGPPRARRRRRYGRGPNKYTRNWEDEEAYNKPPITRTKKPIKPKRNVEEFPPLGGNPRNDNTSTRNSSDRDIQDNVERESSERIAENNGNFFPSNQQQSSNSVSENVRQHHQNNPSQQEANANKALPQPRVGTGRVVKPKKEIKDSDYRGFTTRSRQVRNAKVEQKPVPNRNHAKKEDFIQSQNFTNRNSGMQELEKDMGKLNVQEGTSHGKGGKQHAANNAQRQGSVPPRLQSEQKGSSKRYSSMRQRSLPESATPPNYPTSFYPNGGPQSSQAPLLHTPPGAQMPQLSQQVPVTAAPLLQAQFPPPPFAQAPPPFLQPGVPPPTQFIPAPAPQTAQILNYVQGQAGFPAGFQGYQQQFNPVVNTPPTELYQPQGGITYYSADQQVQSQRPAPQKRPKAAIPIVAPPGNETKARTKKDEDTNQANPDNTVENAVISTSEEQSLAAQE
ncbi:protein CASC3 isoform X2 [Aethina tumida]|uniref:protein CASC3 isoform X2 n=1 Tax=Aethina tumida TaxID=116153 RepID=UPI0021492FC7|nr:protein CASC3 isoform X2 [Aethina tumida]